MWKQYFNLIRIHRGRIITSSHGELDFSRDDIPVKTCQELYEAGFPYLELTEEGKKELYGIEPGAPTSTTSDSELPEIDKNKAMTLETVGTEVPPPNRKKYANKKSSE